MAEAAGAAVPEPLLRGLPDEISIWEILVRLSPKAILRCRAVCPTWRRATSSRDFLLAHYRRQPTFPLLTAFDSGDDEDPESSISMHIIPFDHRAGLTAVDQLLRQSVARIGDEFFNLEASCDGLLVLSLAMDPDFIICNPATRQYAPLPMIRNFNLLGMYRHSPTGEYRILLMKYRDLMDDDTWHVFTIGSGQPPTPIGYNAGISSAALLLHGSLHWHKYRSQMIVFDTTAETFRQMRSPVVSDDAGLFEIDGMLGMSSLSDGETIMDIWVMHDYEGEVWAIKHRVELPVAQLTLQFGEFYSQLCVVVPSGDGDVIVLVNFGDWVLQIDSDGKLVASFHHRSLSPSKVRLQQTLVPHTFFPALEGYVVNAPPFIF